MSNNGWPMVPLDEVLRHVDREESVDAIREYRQLGVRLDGAGPFLRRTRLGSEIAAKRLSRVEANDFIYSRLFAWRGAFGVVSKELNGSYVSSEFPTFVPSDGRIDVWYLNFWLRLSATLSAVAADCTGSTPLTRNRFKEEFFLRLRIPLPPLAEQRRIVAKIDQLAAKIAEARGLRGRIGTETEVLVSSARRGYFRQIATMTVGHPLGNVADCRLGKMLSQAAKTGAASAPYLRNANIRNDGFDLSSVYEMDFHEHERPVFLLQSGDLLVNEGGYGVGRCAVWQGQISPCYFQKSLHRIRVDQKCIAPRFLMHHFLWANEDGHFDDITMTTTFQHLTGVRLKRYEVHIPRLDRQAAIVAYLDDLQAKVDRLKALQAQTAAELDALLPSILDKAFKGEL